MEVKKQKKEGKGQLPKQLETSDEEETRRCFLDSGKARHFIYPKAMRLRITPAMSS